MKGIIRFVDAQDTIAKKKSESKTMDKIQLFAIVACLGYAILTIGFAYAEDLIIFPNKGQSKEQMERDKFECYSWTKTQSGFDPMKTPQASAPPPSPGAKKGGLFRGAARGADYKRDPGS